MKPNRVLIVPLSLLCVALFGAGCSHLFSWTSSPPKARVQSDLFVTNSYGEVVTMNILQLKAMRFADDYSATIAQATDDFAKTAGTSEARLAALKWKLGQSTAAFTDASGVNPIINALDLLVLVTAARMVIEDYAVPKFGTNAVPLLETQKRMETKVWELAKGMLTAKQKEEFNAMILEWRRQNPEQRYVGPLRFVEFANALGKMPKSGTPQANSIFSLLFIDPLAGLDPTAAAIVEVRELGERLLYYGQRMPQLVGWQSEVIALEMASQPESRQILTNAQQIATAVSSFAKTAAELPQVIREERRAAIDQSFDRLQQEMTNAGTLMVQTRETVSATTEAAQAINAAIRSLDEFVRVTCAPPTNVSLVATNKRPFDVLDYGQAAVQIGSAAKDLSAALATLNQTTPELAKLSQRASANADRMVMRAFWLGLALVAIFIIGLALAGRFWRR